MEAHCCSAPAVGSIFFIMFFVFTVFISLAVTALLTWAWCKIFHRAGFPWALGLLTLVPIANVIIPVYFAFAKWPVLEKTSQA